jgi:hypothetical protein
MRLSASPRGVAAIPDDPLSSVAPMSKPPPKAKLALKAIKAIPNELVLDLPASKYRGIGKIISAHAFLENQVFEVLCDLAKIDYSVGRVTLRYQAATERFKIIKRLMVLHSINTKTNLSALFTEIEKCCGIRDIFAHGVWVWTKHGDLGMRITKGEFEIDDGIVDRSFMPQVSTYSDGFFDTNRTEILKVAEKVSELKDQIAAALTKRTAEIGAL